MSTVHHPTGITVEIVGIEANSNGRSCFQHDVCGTLVEKGVVLRLQKVQILNSLGREETAIAAYQVSDGINQCCVGFLQRQFVTNAKTFDGILAQVTAVYSVGSMFHIRRTGLLSTVDSNPGYDQNDPIRVNAQYSLLPCCFHYPSYPCYLAHLVVSN
jgi:hypothetical protein